MSEKEYPMPDEYNKYAAQLLDFIETRDQVLAAMKDMTPAQKREVQEPLKVLNKSIEELEKGLAKQYEEYQKERRAEESKNELGDDIWRRLLEMYVVVKHRMPENLDKLTEQIDKFTPEAREAFFDQVAILETEILPEILAEINLGNRSDSN